MGMPIVIKNSAGKLATIELNKDTNVVCRFHPNNSVYLGDTHLEKWYPSSLYKREVYQFINYTWR